MAGAMVVRGGSLGTGLLVPATGSTALAAGLGLATGSGAGASVGATASVDVGLVGRACRDRPRRSGPRVSVGLVEATPFDA